MCALQCVALKKIDMEIITVSCISCLFMFLNKIVDLESKSISKNLMITHALKSNTIKSYLNALLYKV